MDIDYVPGIRSTEFRLEFDTCGGLNITWSIEREEGNISDGTTVG